MRPAVLAVGTAAIAGCTFLVAFDDPLPPLPATEAGPLPPDAATPDARAAFDPTKSDACKGLPNGHFCGNNQLVGYPFGDDLVECTDGGIGEVQICTQCLHLKNPHPDQCDECGTKVDVDGGFFCGSEFPGWVTSGSNSNAKIYVHCQSGRQDLIDQLCVTCTPGVDSKGAGAAKCTK